MAMNIERLNDEYAASFVLHVLAMETKQKAFKKQILGLKTTAFDVIVNRGAMVDGCATYSFYAYKPFSMTFAPPFLSVIALKEIAKQLTEHVMGQLSPAFEMGKGLTTPFKFSHDTGRSMANAQKLAGQMQLLEAEKMKVKSDKINTMNQSSASRLQYAGAAKFEAQVDPKCILITLDYRPGRRGLYVVDRYEGKDHSVNCQDLFRKMDEKWGSTIYVFWPGSGLFEKLG